MRLVWLTDIHLNFIDANAREEFYKKIIDANADAILISGDIAEAPFLLDILNEAVTYINKPIYFVLGNHDYYLGQINEVRKEMTALTASHSNLFWLPASGIKKLNIDTYLIGQDGWADGRLGDFQNSSVVINDSRMIADLFQEKILGRQQLLHKMQKLADADATKLQKDLERVIHQNPKKIIVLTHVPPCKEACMYKSKISDYSFLPYFSSKIMGDILMEFAQQNPTVNFLVLCGHTHNEATCQPIANLTIEVGKAEYYQPEIQKIIEVAS
jgi:Icc-related predicted phosphoesterase